MTTKFKEIQKFNQWWLWLILLAIGGLAIIGIIKYFLLEKGFGEHPMSPIGLIIISLVIFSLIALFIVMKLTTTIDENGIQMNLYPFLKEKASWNEIKDIEVVNYGFVGGWGIRFSSNYGTVYNIRGNKGLAIELKTGAKYLIGTQCSEELNDKLAQFKQAIK